MQKLIRTFKHILDLISPTASEITPSVCYLAASNNLHAMQKPQRAIRARKEIEWRFHNNTLSHLYIRVYRLVHVTLVNFARFLDTGLSPNS